MTGSRAIDRVTVLRGDITLCRVDAIVNAANSALKRGGGVDGAIHRAAGPELQRELDGIGGCPTGECRISGAYGLPASRLIHCVGPVWRGGSAGEDAALAGCYRSALLLADGHGLATIAFPAISTGIYGFPRARGAHRGRYRGRHAGRPARDRRSPVRLLRRSHRRPLPGAAWGVIPHPPRNLELSGWSRAGMVPRIKETSVPPAGCRRRGRMA